MKSKNFLFKKLFSLFLSEKNYHKIKSRKIILDIERRIDYDDIDALISKIIPSDAVIIDVGANMGQCTGRFSLALPSAKIYSLEPIGENFVAVNNMIKKLSLNNVETFQIGISDSEGSCEITIPILKGVVVSTQASLENLDAFKSEDVELRKEVIKIETLSGFIKRNSITRIDLIKIDTEGHDYKVINSGKDDILRMRPIIKMENNWNSNEIGWLYENNFEVFQIKDKKLCSPKKYSDLKGDSILVPKEYITRITNFIN